MLPSVQPGKVDAALVLLLVSAAKVVTVASFEEVDTVEDPEVAVGPLEAAWLLGAELLPPPPHATLKVRPRMIVPKKSLFI
jgi:hypothetical protein